MLDYLIKAFEERKEKGCIEDQRSADLIDLYIKGIQNSQESESKKLNQLMILKCLIMSGDDMWLTGSAEEFHKAYRSWGVIYSRGIGSYDSVMWNLMHMDDLIWKCLEEVGIV